MLFQTDIINSLSDLWQAISQTLPRISRAILFVIIGLIVVRLFMRLFSRIIEYFRISLGLKEILIILIRGGLWVLLAIGVLQILGLTNIAFALGGFIAALSIGISQGFTQTVTDLVSGIQLANDHDFRVGDKVVLGATDMRVEGYIVEMDTKKTRVLDSTGNLHVLPNALVDKNEWTVIERDEITLAHLKRSDIIKVINNKLKKGRKKS